ncbi:hypothetical protein B0H12DRAFT_1231065 [Mycena haematopus]|nr:hypothetical protein B0H12DRAFT_1231065 [Mycena haematopus]
MPELALFGTQRLPKEEAAASIAPLLAHAEAMKAGYSVRLVPRTSFVTSESRTALVEALMAASGAPPPDASLMIIQITAPTAARSAGFAPGRTSVTPAWRDAVYHATSMGCVSPFLPLLCVTLVFVSSSSSFAPSSSHR